MNIVAVGDSHGEYERLKDLVETVKQSVTEPFKFVFLGDYIDRGPDSALVVQFVKTMTKEGHVALRGNHEDMMMDAFKFYDASALWFRNGGEQTMHSYSRTYKDSKPNVDQMVAEDVAWFETLWTHYVTERHFFVHAGVDPTKHLEDQGDETYLWTRNFLGHPERLSHFVVHGHTPYDPTKKEGLWSYPGGINLDTGAVFGHKLTAALFTPEQDLPVKVWQT